jgi:mono/diheme cytochrome c family protein
VAKGEALAGGGYCAECHTVKGGQKFAGGYAMPTPFGVLYSTNITPDPQNGIGTWSEAAFARAMHKGVARDGSHLFPGFPYDHFTKLSDDAVKALYDIPDFYKRLIPRRGVETTCVEEVRKYDVSEYWKELV